MSQISDSSQNQGGSSISQNNKSASVSQKNSSSSFPIRVEKELNFNIDEKGFYKRDVKLLIDENGSLIGTENKDNLLLSIEDRDTIDFTSEISGLNNIDHG